MEHEQDAEPEDEDAGPEASLELGKVREALTLVDDAADHLDQIFRAREGIVRSTSRELRDGALGDLRRNVEQLIRAHTAFDPDTTVTVGQPSAPDDED